MDAVKVTELPTSSRADDIGPALQTLNLLIADMEAKGLKEEANILTQAMGRIWKIARRRLAIKVKSRLEREGELLDETEQDFLNAISRATPAMSKEIMKEIAKAVERKTH